MNTAEAPLGTIVAAVDGSPSSDLAVDFAVDQARLTRRPLTLVHALSPMDTVWLAPVGMSPSMGTGVGLEALETQAKELLAEVRATWPPARRARGARVPRLRRPPPGAAGRRDARVDDRHGLPGRGPVRSLLLGSVAVGVSHHVTCPLVVMRPTDGAERSGVLVAVDATERSMAPLSSPSSTPRRTDSPSPSCTPTGTSGTRPCTPTATRRACTQTRTSCCCSPRSSPAWRRSTPTWSCTARSRPAWSTWPSWTRPRTRSSSCSAPTTAAVPARCSLRLGGDHRPGARELHRRRRAAPP